MRIHKYTFLFAFAFLASDPIFAQEQFTIEEAIQAIEKYENKLGFISAQRCLKSLFQLLFEDIAPGR